MLYSKNGQYPTLLPYRIRMPDGSTRTDPSSFNNEILLAAGYKSVEDPPSSIGYNQILEWDGNNWRIITREEVTEPFTLPPLE